MRILITGGTGFIGNALAEKLLSLGHEVHAVGRSAFPPPEKLLPGLQYHVHDLSRELLPAGLLQGTHAVFHVAAKAGVDGRYEEYKLANLTATQRVLEACLNHGVSHLIYTSTPSVVFSTRSIRGGDESLPYSTEVVSAYATTKSLAEQAVLGANNPSGLRTLALRPHLVWGKGDPHLLPRVIRRHRAGKLKIVGDGKNLVDLTHVDNVVHAHLRALDSMVAHSLLGGKAYFIGQNEPVMLWEWLNLVFTKLGLPKLETSIPFGLAHAIGRGMEMAWNVFPLRGEPPMTRFVACQLAHDHWFSSQAAEQDLGYEPVISMEEALNRTLPWLKTL